MRRKPLGTLGGHVPSARPCGTCGNQIRPARFENGSQVWVDAEPVPDKREHPEGGLIAYRRDKVAVGHSQDDLRIFYPTPAFRLHLCPRTDVVPST